MGKAVASYHACLREGFRSSLGEGGCFPLITNN